MMPTPSPVVTSPATNWPARLGKPVIAWGLLLAYLLLHLVVRMWASPNIGTDDVEAAIFAQGWAWGYNVAQPPLYTWMLLASYAVLGVGTFAHIALKYLLVGITYGCAWSAARRMAEPATATVAAASIVLLFGFAWGVHAGVTHTLTLGALIGATLLALMRVAERRRLVDYAVLGLVAGLGFLSKYSYGIFLCPLLIAAAIDRQTRPAVRDWRLIVVFVVAALVFLPHGLWMLAEARNYGGRLANIAGVAKEGGYVAHALRGFASLIEASVLFLVPFLAIAAGLLYPGWKRRSWQTATPWTRVVLLAIAIGMLLLVATILFAGATYFKDRRMHAILLTLPLGLVALAAGVELARWRRRTYLVLLALVPIASLGGLIGQALLEARDCRNCRLHVPIPEFADSLRDTGMPIGTLLVGDEHLGGNLRLAFPNARTATPIYSDYIAPLPAGAEKGECVLAWNARNYGRGVPNNLADFARSAFGTPPTALAAAQPIIIDMPMRRNPARVESFGYAVVPGVSGSCK